MQEVGGLKQLAELSQSTPGPLKEVQLPEGQSSALEGFTLLGTSETSSHLSLVMAFHETFLDHIVETVQGDRFIGARVLTKAGSKLWFVTVHLPHSDNDFELFEAAVIDLARFVRRRAGQNIVLAGDWNAIDGSPRALFLDATLSELRVFPYRSGQSTRFSSQSSSELDYFYASSVFMPQVIQDSIAVMVDDRRARFELGSDHAPVFMHFCVQNRLSKRKLPRRRRCGSYIVDTGKLHNYVATGCFRLEDMHVTQQWEIIKSVAHSVLYRCPSHKYQDPPNIKNLCRQRQLETDPMLRAEMTRRIIGMRLQARRHWWSELEALASQGVSSATRYIRQRSKPQATCMPFVRNSGRQASAASQVKDRMQHIFQHPAPEEVSNEVDAIVGELLSKTHEGFHRAISEPEVIAAVSKVQNGKSSGMSGVSGEFFKALIQHKDGLDALRQHFDLLLHAGDFPTDYQQTYVCLIPKLQAVTKASELRPINLIEVIHKIYTTILCHRVCDDWPIPSHQLGGLRGCQSLDALFCTASYFDKESVMQQYSIWFNTDIASAFDSISHVALAQFLQRHATDDNILETARLIQVATQSTMLFQWGGEEFYIQQSRGIQQGGTHSCLLFSAVLGVLLGQLQRDWSREGESNTHGVFLWTYIDDLLLCFKDWDQALRLSARLQEALRTLGLQINPEKSSFVSHVSRLQVDRASFPRDSLPFQCKWEEQAIYLRKAFRHWDSMPMSNGNKLIPTIIASCQASFETLQPIMKVHTWMSPAAGIHFLSKYVGSKFLWYTPLIDPNVANINVVRTVQNLAIVKVLKLHIPEHLDFRSAMPIQVLRKRVAYHLLDNRREHSWAHNMMNRKWNYLGHLIRRGDDHLARAALLAGVRDFTSGRMGPWNSHLKWLYDMACKIYCVAHPWSFLPANIKQIADQLQVWADNRSSWKDKARYFQNLTLLPCTFCVSTSWQHWRDPLRHEVPWLASVYICRKVSRTQGVSSFKAFFVEREDGLLEFDVGFEITHDSLSRFISHLQMLRSVACVQLLVSENAAETYLHTVKDINSHYVKRDLVVIAEIVPVSWLASVWNLSQQN